MTIKSRPSQLHVLAILLILISANNADAQVSASGEKIKPPRGLDQTLRTSWSVVESTDFFEFHSGFWINLHHFLYQQAILCKATSVGEVRQPGKVAPCSIPPDKLSATEQLDWDAALDYYRNTLVKRDLLFDEGMWLIKNQLADLEMASGLRESSLNPELITTLERAAPIYRSRWWAEQNRTNRHWVKEVIPVVRQLGNELTAQLASAYHTKWPTGRIRVDIVGYASRTGAYTTDAPLHITISSANAHNQGDIALEVLFHEASHGLVDVKGTAVSDAIARECHARQMAIPRHLWHAIIFYTAGEIIRRHLQKLGNNAYVPYAYRYGIYEVSPEWQGFRRPLELYWQPYLDGTSDFESAIAHLVDALKT